jgi:transposase
LEDRTADVFAGWLRQHPGVEIIVRDRAGAYAEGDRQGAPGAIQVADRFHLSANATAALDEALRSRRRRIEYVVVASDPEPEVSVTPALPPPPISRTKQGELDARRPRTARWQNVRERHATGEPILRIARDLGMSRMTVRRFIHTPEAPRNRSFERHRAGGLTSPSLIAYREYLEARWQAGCSNIAQLFREVEALGYHGSRSLLYRVLVPWRRPRPPPNPATGVDHIVGDSDRVGSTFGGCVCDLLINWMTTNAMRLKTSSPTMSASPPATSCFSASDAWSRGSAFATSTPGLGTLLPLNSGRS